MKVWEKTTVGEVADGLYDGPHATPKPSKTGPVFLGIKNIAEDGTFDFSDVRHISYDEYPNWVKRVVPSENDIVFSYEATLHRYAIIPTGFKGCLGRRMALIRTNQQKINYKFLYYYFFTNKWREEVDKNVLIGSTVNRIPLSNFPKFALEIPDLETQNKIASIISCYDNLIENNQKRINILREMIQRLYAEWFVKFKFPGSGSIKMVPSETELGLIPNGWGVKLLASAIKIIRGKSYSSDEIDSYEGKYYLVNLKSFNRNGGFRFDGKKYFNGNVNSNQILNTGDIVIAVTDMTRERAVIARPAIIPKINHKLITLSADVVKIVSESLPNTFLFALLSDDRFTETTKAKANGANVLHLKPNLISDYLFVLPPSELMSRFNHTVSKNFNLIDDLNTKNDGLVEMRNILIEELVTGKKHLE